MHLTRFALQPLAHATLITLAASLLPLAAQADFDATGDDGREIRLKENGQWEYRSNDRFATSSDGTRVRLKDNGQWEFIGNAPVKTQEQVRTEALDVKLADVIIETYKEKTAKSARFNSRTTFELLVDVSGYSKQAVATQLSHFNLIEVKDTHGNKYPVLSITPQTEQLQPGQEYRIQIVVDGSPTGKFAVLIKALEINIDKAVFGTQNDLTFTRRVDETKRIKREEQF